MRGIVEVFLWGTRVGALGYGPEEPDFATFEYDQAFMESGVQLSPIHLKYPPSRFIFKQLSYKSFSGLPGFIADSLPDKYGNHLIDLYMAEKNIPPTEVRALDRLNYVSNRGMGALEYRPGESLPLKRTALNLHHLAELADRLQQRKENLHRELQSPENKADALTMIRIGSSAGGARSKALVALSEKGTLLDGTIDHGPHYSYWLLKFDSLSNKDKDHKDPKGLPVLEYIYSLIAREAGIDMPRTRIIDDGEDRHFLIERFDRVIRNGKLDKLHYGSWSGIAHADRDQQNSYEQLILLIRQMKLGQAAITEAFRRALFNIIGRNQDDHSKNTGFLMNRSGKWQLSPAFDLTYAYDPQGKWTRNHQCWLNSKNRDFEKKDLLQFGRFCNLTETQSCKMIDQTLQAFSHFSSLAKEWELPDPLRKTVEKNLRLLW